MKTLGASDAMQMAHYKLTIIIIIIKAAMSSREKETDGNGKNRSGSATKPARPMDNMG